MNLTNIIDIICIGETLIDFIGHQKGVQLNNTKDYHRYLGGSPTNVAMNLARLGLKPALIASVGNDGFGDYIFQRVGEARVSAQYIKRNNQLPTSTVFVSRSTGTPDFIAYRAADSLITEDQVPVEILSHAQVYHTTCFALSKQPARNTILNKAKEAYDLGCKLSIDLNYSEKIWKETDEAIKVIKKYCSYNPLVKLSKDDMNRLFGYKISINEVFDFFHKNGVDIVCLTLGEEGVILSQKGKPKISKPAIKIAEVVDTTGAGDAFWSGFLFAYIKRQPIEKCLITALKLAALKLQNVGRLPDSIKSIAQLLAYK
ncbi:carbohydrate kinase family protein [Aquimarina sp. W85]|uniref:carbohydrate kinase family protein n=1 Tax=Aquimarina rhodophyticola TaxID=3342246 RepID=UPI00366E4B53